jgi:hypothetical protein
VATLASPPEDLDASRAAVAARDLVATVSAYLTDDVAVRLPFEALGTFKSLLRRFLSTEPWEAGDTAALDALVRPHVGDGWWEHDLGAGLTLAHGVRAGHYELWVGGASEPVPSIFDRAFDGPVVPEPTPHPRKVKFTTGGAPAPGVWYRRGDPEPVVDEKVRRLFAEPDVTDVMVAGDFVTVGIAATSSWERRLEPLLALVSELYGAAGGPAGAAERTREELLSEAGGTRLEHRPEELHLLDPDDPADRATLEGALDSAHAKTRRIAVAVLAESGEPAVRGRAVWRGFEDASRTVRRTAVDAAAAIAADANVSDPGLRPLFTTALGSDDAWIRWKAVRALGDLDPGPTRDDLELVLDDPDFQVRFEVEKVLRDQRSAP